MSIRGEVAQQSSRYRIFISGASCNAVLVLNADPPIRSRRFAGTIPNDLTSKNKAANGEQLEEETYISSALSFPFYTGSTLS